MDGTPARYSVFNCLVVTHLVFCMTRPERIYLDEMITIDSIKIGHTLEGLKYLIDHYTHIMNNATKTQMDDKARQHFQVMITDMQLHLHLYEKQFLTINPNQNENTISQLPQSI